MTIFNMKTTLVTFFAALAARHSLASVVPSVSDLVSRQDASCTNSATSRNCWGQYSVDTDYYSVTPNTGVTREYYLSVENTTVSPDGYSRFALTFNGTVPGPTIIADWGDNLVIHVTNNLEYNGTAIHWHGIRQLKSVEYDGVPGVTQCPIAPGDTLTYRFQATQYGSTWYHSHFSLQYGDGLLGPMIINGPATSDYDEDLGALFLSDWSHTPVSKLWDSAKLGAPPTLETGLINGTNTFDCTDSTDANCVGGGKKFEATFEAGKKYRFRIINSAVDGHFQFSIDGHNFTVMGNDLVPIVPFVTDSLLVSIGQRYDIVVEASAASGDYWLRAGWISTCSTNADPDNMTGIIRYDSTSTADPTTNSTVTASTSCGDEPAASLVPHLSMDVGNFSSVNQEELSFAVPDYFRWTLNSSSLELNWTDPTTLKIFNNESIWPSDYNVQPLAATSTSDVWTVWVIEDDTGFGITHPIHLHGHDFWVIAQETATFDIDTVTWNLDNPPRRDVASLPGNGFLAIAFKKDNPGSWLMHCHIAWHASEGFAMQFVERQSEIAVTMTDTNTFDDTCSAWNKYTPNQAFPQEDSGV
ncbi:Laccase [Lachnellula subtilissima]|uniref:laccase n=1 Tax=Lachnellula subtilissima TaxID=602034 RepID=A0A8H8RSJ0_9HELO|nr:Laccase [Lachnellula subtilissima]